MHIVINMEEIAMLRIIIYASMLLLGDVAQGRIKDSVPGTGVQIYKSASS